MKPFQTTFMIGILCVLSLVLSACVGVNENTGTSSGSMDAMDAMSDEVPADLDTASNRITDQGIFQAQITSNMIPVDINELHSWTLHLETPDGQPIEDAEIIIDGGMPQHNHGFPTSPQVTENLGNGDYLVEGVRFNMTGWWEMKFDISAGGENDQITFNLVVETGHEGEAVGHMDHAAHGDTMDADTLMVQNIVANLSLPTETGAIYMTIVNGTHQDEVLLSASVEGCDAVELHQSKMDGDVMTMTPVESGQLAIPTGETVHLEPGSMHLMCIGKSQTFAIGDEVPITLSFTNAGDLQHMIEVRAPGDMAMDNHDTHDHNAHDHEKIANDGAMIHIVLPEDGAEVAAGEMIMVVVEAEGIDLTADDNHWHLYVDGELVEMIEGSQTETMIHGLEPGKHTIMTTLANADHAELEDGSMISVTVK